jgi:GrpB-like predicted nucleotidyltransferase (UPF0157 family)
MIAILEYQSRWPTEFDTLGTAVRDALGPLAVRVDHIGSTSVPGLAAKDIIDIQVTVAALESPVEAVLESVGYTRIKRLAHDHVPLGATESPENWEKWFFNSGPDRRRVNLHVRVAGRANQRYPVLFRDYLRSNKSAAEAYALVKLALARYHADNVEAYYDVKDPVCDIIMAGAELWATRVAWQQGPSDR